MKLDYNIYFNKVYGALVGKSVGGAAGAKQENNKSLMNYTLEDVFPDVIPPNDDFDLQVLYLKEVIQKKGSSLTSDDLAKAFEKYNICLANEYSIAIKNIELGIMPPHSGVFNNDFFKFSMGCPIRSEIWAMICPGDPEAAARYAMLDGMVDHDVESIYGEQFYAAMEACAVSDSDLNSIINKGLKIIPEDSVVAKCVKFVVEQYCAKEDWLSVREKLIARFGSSDASYCPINIGIVIGALLYGNGDFVDTMLTAINSGYDTDCTSATSCAILGIINGAESIPEYCLNKIGNIIDVGTVAMEQTKFDLTELVRETCEAGLAFSRDGVISTEFINIPSDVKINLPLPEAKPEIEIISEYAGLPSIAYGENTKINIKVKNNTAMLQEGVLKINTPAELIVNISIVNLSLSPNSEQSLTLDFTVKRDISALPQKNLIEIEFETSKIKAKTEFGLSGAYAMKLIGPFYDLYDTKKYDKDPYNSVMQKDENGWGDLYAMFNGFIDIDRCYIDESFKSIDKLQGESVNFHYDTLEIEDKIGYQGPCCVYLVYDFISPEGDDDACLFVGNNQPFKVWLNSQPILCDSSSKMFMIYNNAAGGLHFNKGKNRIIIKAVRQNAEIKFGFRIRNVKNRLHWFTSLSSVIDGNN